MNAKVLKLLALLGLSAGPFAPTMVLAQAVGDFVELRSSNPEGVPVHPADGERAYVRWPNGSTGIVREVGRWYRIQAADGDQGWITRSYVTVVQVSDEDEPDDADPDAGAGQQFRVIGSWNIEHFKTGASRGFPENAFGSAGPTYPQEERDLKQIAALIRDDLRASVLALSEINGTASEDPPRSEEMELLIAELGPSWEYVLSSDGGSQRVALLSDSSKAQRAGCFQFTNHAGPRDHLGCKYSLLADDGSAKNDLVVIGVHLKSGQGNVTQHNQEMAELATQITETFGSAPFDSELDVLIAGDFNANRYDNEEEDFWVDFASPFDIDVLAPELGVDYPATRLRGVPLRPGSLIDYVMGSRVAGGVAGDLVRTTAHVHHELLVSPIEEFRRIMSDQFPVTVRVLLKSDDD